MDALGRPSVRMCGADVFLSVFAGRGMTRIGTIDPFLNVRSCNGRIPLIPPPAQLGYFRILELHCLSGQVRLNPMTTAVPPTEATDQQPSTPMQTVVTDRSERRRPL